MDQSTKEGQEKMKILKEDLVKKEEEVGRLKSEVRELTETLTIT